MGKEDELHSHHEKPVFSLSTIRHAIIWAFILAVYSVTFSLKTVAKANSEHGNFVVMSGKLEARLDDDPNSGYRVLLEKLLPKPHTNFSYRHLPVARAVREFSTNEKVCLYPTSAKLMEMLSGVPKETILESVPIDIVSSHVFSSPEDRPILSLLDLNKRSIAAQKDTPIRQFFPPSVQVDFIRAPNDLSALRMLLAGRADSLYGWLPDVYIMADKNNLPYPSVDEGLAIFRSSIHMVCKKFQQAGPFLNQVTSRINALKTSGEMRVILGPHARIVEQ